MPAQTDIIEDNLQALLGILKWRVRVDNSESNGVCIPIEFTAKALIDKFFGDVSDPCSGEYFYFSFDMLLTRSSCDRLIIMSIRLISMTK